MAKFNPVVRKARFDATGYSPQSMLSIADQLGQQEIIPRIRKGLDIYDNPAPALKRPAGNPNSGYPRRKQIKGLQPIRDWFFTGRTLRSMKTLTAGQNRSVIGFTDAAANMRAAINNRRWAQFGVSPKNRIGLARIVATTPEKPVKAVQVA